MQYTSATLAEVVIASLSYAWISSSGASAPQDTPRPRKLVSETCQTKAAFFQKVGIGKLEFLKKRIARCQNLLGAGKFNKNGHPACGTLFACVSDEEEL